MNDGYDDQNYDYILQVEEEVLQRYVLKDRIGKVQSPIYSIDGTAKTTNPSEELYLST